MFARSIRTQGRSCECGDKMRWRAHGWFDRRWRLECVCGRSGPWRSTPELEQLIYRVNMPWPGSAIPARPGAEPYRPASGGPVRGGSE